MTTRERERKTDHETHRGLEKKREAFEAAQRLRVRDEQEGGHAQ